jgi:hypothetical protein
MLTWKNAVVHGRNTAIQLVAVRERVFIDMMPGARGGGRVGVLPESTAVIQAHQRLDYRIRTALDGFAASRIPRGPGRYRIGSDRAFSP